MANLEKAAGCRRWRGSRRENAISHNTADAAIAPIVSTSDMNTFSEITETISDPVHALTPHADGSDQLSPEAEMRTDWIERQLAEVESLRAIFFEDGAVRTDDAILEAMSLRLRDGSRSLDLPSPLSLSVRLGHGEVSSDEGCASSTGLRLALVLPHYYPEDGGDGPIIWLEPDDGTTVGPIVSLLAGDEDLCADLQIFAREMATAGEECLLQLVQHTSDIICDRIATFFDAQAAGSGAGEADECLARALLQEEIGNADPFDDEAADQCFDIGDWQAAAPVAGPPLLGRRSMYSHHIIAESKRKAISEWAVQLQLGGLAKIGWPGLIIVEGDERNVRMYVDALSRLRWKHFVVRGEQTVEGRAGQTVDDLRALPRGFEEFGTEGMSEFASRCREHGVEELFFACMKISSATGGKSKRTADVDHGLGATPKSTVASAGATRRGRKR